MASGTYLLELYDEEENNCACERCDRVAAWVEEHRPFFPPEDPRVDEVLIYYSWPTCGVMPFYYTTDFNKVPDGIYRQYLLKYIVARINRVKY